ncbi:hypothetical protein ACFRFO_08670 [Streptomyces sp. NPDC056664]|uniref:hypothetical protein n=1 Tax=unclassified Streptomyces TaxID=2593676 RepID=UPI0027DF2973|nr:hypothetical protein [Streptomyces sp. CB02980]
MCDSSCFVASAYGFTDADANAEELAAGRDLVNEDGKVTSDQSHSLRTALSTVAS